MSLSAIIPQTPGYLPKWLLFVSVMSVGNTLQAFLTLSYTRRLYNRAPTQVTALSARTFGLWTMFSGLIRLYAAYNITDVHVYRVVVLTYVVALLHFASEAFIYRTAGLDGAVNSPLVVAITSLIWMCYVWEDYVN